jgi:hypothetical protein
MPMRGPLPLVHRPVQERRAAASLEQALLLAIGSTDFAVISAFTVAGVLASLCFELAQPQSLAAIALLMLGP